MKSLIAIAVFAIATAGTGFAQTNDAAKNHGVAVQGQVVKEKSRTERDEAENRITEELNRHQLANVVGSSASPGARSLPQTATRPADTGPF